MSENISEGRSLYLEDKDSRPWFVKQWKHWPTRVDERYTTNISFLYGGILAYRELTNLEPEVSKEYAYCVEWLDDHG